MSLEITGRWEELLARPEFRGRRVRVTVVDEPAPSMPAADAWLESLRAMARNGVRITRPADDSRGGVYPGDRVILVDTNILLRLIQIGHPHQQPALDAMALLRTRDREQFVSCPQSIYEMYAICTRPADAPNPGLGLGPAAAMKQIEAALRQFPVEPEPGTVLARWQELAVQYGVIAKSTHDARLVALMVERQIPRLLTFNDSHFVRYREIAVLNPFDMLGVSRA